MATIIIETMAKNSLDAAVDLDYAPRKLAFGLPALTPLEHRRPRLAAR